MKFFSTIFALASAAVVYAQSNPNPFNIPTEGLQTSAGSTVNLTWTPTTPGTVSLVLRYGNSAFLNQSGTIASSLPNNGQYTWSVPSDIARGSSYAIEIISDSDTSLVNYTPQFIIDSSILTASNSLVASATASGSASVSAAASTTSSGSTTGSATASASASGSSSVSGASTSSARSSVSSAGIQTVSATGAAAPRATAMAGMLGVVALGALAL